jgi:hypothetical protein
MFSLWAPLSLLFLISPLPVAWVSLISFKGFRRESLASLAVLPGALLGGKFLVFALALPLGCIWASNQARNIYNGRNEFYTLSRAAGGALMVCGLVASGVFIYSYSTDPLLQERVREEVIDQSIRVSALSGGGMEAAFARQKEAMVGFSKEVVTASEVYVKNELASSGELLTPGQLAALERGFEKAREEIPASLEVSPGGTPGVEDLRPLVEEQLRPYLEPGRNSAVLILATVMSIVWVLQLPFGILAGIYGKLILKRLLG